MTRTGLGPKDTSLEALSSGHCLGRAAPGERDMLCKEVIVLHLDIQTVPTLAPRY